jgi:hypothetical protein
MAQFEIRYGVSGGYNDIQTEVIEVDTLAQAESDAYDAACEMFESYDVFGNQNPDYDYDSEDYQDDYNEERENWIEYSARPAS